MGGDDLGSDDEYLAPKLSGEQKKVEGAKVKRVKDVVGDEDEGQEEDEKELDSRRETKRTKMDNPKQVLQVARHLDCQSPKQQAAFLQKALNDYTLLKTNNNLNDGTILPAYFQSSDKSCLLERLKEVVSLKKLKSWKHKASPCVIVICISARRSVAVLKELAPLKLRMAKLFPKNGSVDEQLQQLSAAPFGVAVGTPHRLLQVMLAAAESNSKGATTSAASASSQLVSQTQLVVFDCHASQKQFTVCTLPDTAPHCMSLMNEHVLPQLQKRNDIRIAFF